MAFALLGSDITQTGTDDTASTITGISALAGVTTVVDQNSTRLIFPYKLIVQGTMTCDSGVAFTFDRPGSFANELDIDASGTFTYEHVRNENGFNNFYELPDMVFTQDLSTAFNGTASNGIRVNGILNLSKVKVIADAGHNFIAGTTTLREVTLNLQNITVPNDVQITTQLNSPTLDVDDLTIIGGTSFITTPNLTAFNNYKPTFMRAGIGTGGGTILTLENFQPQGCTFDVAMWNGGILTLRNSSKGGGNVIGPWAAPTPATNTTRVTRTIRITASDELGASVPDFKMYYTDNATGGEASTHNGITYAVPLIYNVTSVAGNLDAEILLGVSYRDAAIVRRSVTQTDDIYSFPVMSYNHNITATAALDLVGINRLDVPQTLITDQSITETVKATVDAYTALETAAKVYDFGKSYLYGIFTGQATTFVSRTGTVIDAGARDVVYDGTAATPFVVAGNTITINSGTGAAGAYTIQTTGSVSSVNGGALPAQIIDANGDSFLTFANVVSWEVYPTQTDANAQTNVLGSGTSADTFRFTFSGGTTYFVRALSGGVTQFKDSTPIASGETLVDFGVAGAIASNSAAVIAAQVWDSLTADHVIVGSTGEAVAATGGGSAPTAAANAQAVWEYNDAGAFGAATFGNRVVNGIDTAVSTRLAASAYVAPTAAPGEGIFFVTSAPATGDGSLANPYGAGQEAAAMTAANAHPTRRLIAPENMNLPASPALMGVTVTGGGNVNSVVDTTNQTSGVFALEELFLQGVIPNRGRVDHCVVFGITTNGTSLVTNSFLSGNLDIRDNTQFIDCSALIDFSVSNPATVTFLCTNMSTHRVDVNNFVGNIVIDDFAAGGEFFISTENSVTINSNCLAGTINIVIPDAALVTDNSAVGCTVNIYTGVSTVPTASQNAQAVWEYNDNGGFGAQTFGNRVVGGLDTAVSTRLSSTDARLDNLASTKTEVDKIVSYHDGPTVFRDAGEAETTPELAVFIDLYSVGTTDFTVPATNRVKRVTMKDSSGADTLLPTRTREI